MGETTTNYSGFSFKFLVLRFLKNASTYGAFQFLTRFGTFFLIPVYWHYLSPQDYGILGLTAVLQGVLSPILILGINGSIERYYFDWPETERKQKLGALWLLSIIVVFSLAVVIELSADWLFPVLFKRVPYDPYFRLAFWAALVNSFNRFPFNILRITERIKYFGFVSSLTFFINATLVIFFLSVMDLKVIGVLLGSLISGIIFSIFWVIWMFKRIQLNLRFFSVKEEFRYSLVGLPTSLINVFSGNFDRYMLEKYIGLGQLGYYNMAWRLGSYYDEVNNSLRSAWFPMVYKMFTQRNDVKSILPALSLFYFFILTIFALGASLLLKEITIWFGDGKFIAAYQYVPLFILYFLIKNFATAWGRGLDLVKKPQYELLSIVPCAAIGVVLLYFWVPLYGPYGALGALLVSIFLRSSLFVILAHYFYPRIFLFKEVFLLMGVLLIFFLAGSHVRFGSNMINFAVKSLLIIVYILVGGLITFGFHRVLIQLAKLRAKLVRRFSSFV